MTPTNLSFEWEIQWQSPSNIRSSNRHWSILLLNLPRTMDAGLCRRRMLFTYEKSRIRTGAIAPMIWRTSFPILAPCLGYPLKWQWFFSTHQLLKKMQHTPVTATTILSWGYSWRDILFHYDNQQIYELREDDVGVCTQQWKTSRIFPLLPMLTTDF